MPKDLCKLRTRKIKPPCHNCNRTDYRKQNWYDFLDPTWKFCSHKCMFEWTDKHNLLLNGEKLEAVIDGKTKQTISRKQAIQHHL